jgi:quinoprotein glucose dehydrogenase
MMTRAGLLLLSLLVSLAAARADNPGGLWAHDNLHAWCIVPFDAAHRDPEQRAAMLERLGFRHFAYDWRAGDVPNFDAEFDAIQRHHIDLAAVWFPDSGPADQAPQEALLDALRRHHLRPQLWVMCTGAPPLGPDGAQKGIEQQAQRLLAVVKQGRPYGCPVAIYPHDGWAGSPDTDLAILARLRELGAPDVGFVYNFNHAQEDIAQFPRIWARIEPRVTVVNLDGMVEEGPRVLYLGSGDKELEMMRTIEQSGWHGPVGIISEQGDKDAELVLKNNLLGLDWIAAELTKPGSGGPRPDFAAGGGATAAAPAGPAYVPALHDREALDASAGGVTVPNRDDLRHGPLTVECWGRLNNAASYNILVTSDPKASSLHWELYTTQGDGVFGVFLPGMGGDFRSTTRVADSAWHYFAMQLEPGRLRMYVDGKMVRDSPITAPTLAPVAGDIGIGKLVEGPFGCNGCLQDVRISRGVRDVTQVPILPLLHDADTLELWPLDGSTQPGTLTSLPEFRTIPAATRDELTPANGWPSDYTQWTRSNGGSTSNRFVSFHELTKQNVKRLTQAWVYHPGDGSANVQCNPIFVDGLLYVATAGLHLCAIDGATGKEVWRFEPTKNGNGLEDVPARRGLCYWPGDKDNAPRVIFSDGPWLYALDPKTGAPVSSFGHGGRADLPAGGTSVAPVLYQNLIIFPGFANNVYADDVRTGAPVWTFNTLPHGIEFGATTWDADSESHEGCNDWGGISLDESRGIVYAATGSPKPNFLGMLHPGDNLFGNCVLALDAMTGRRLWHFQEIRHDVWDLDIPGSPNVVTVTHDGMKVDAIAQLTKIGDVLLLDRVTGKPLFPFRLRRAPAARLPGERSAVYQPDLEWPEQIAAQQFGPDDVTDLNPGAHEAIANYLKGGTWGRFQSFVEGKPNVYSDIDGGGEWVGASVTPGGRLYASITQRPWDITVHRVAVAVAPATPDGVAGQKIFLQNCAVCHHADRSGNGFAPSLIGLGDRLKLEDVRLIVRHGRGGMPPQPQLSESDINQLGAFLLAKGSANGPVQWTFDGYQHLQDPNNYPGSKPPWGKLVCLDLNTGKIAWQVPAGEYPELTAKGIPKTGTPIMGGPAVTASGLVFLSGSQDPTIGAYDADTGAELWSGRLTNTGSAPPIIYQCNGHEYVALAACGGGKIGGPTGDAWVAFALPEAGVHAADSNVPPSVEGSALLDAYLDTLATKLPLSAEEEAAIRAEYLAGAPAVHEAMNDRSLAPLEQQQRVDAIEQARDARIDAQLQDVERRHAFHEIEAEYRVRLVDLAARGAFTGSQTFETPRPAQD